MHNATIVEPRNSAVAASGKALAAELWSAKVKDTRYTERLPKTSAHELALEDSLRRTETESNRKRSILGKKVHTHWNPCDMKIESTDQDLRTMLSSGYYKVPRFQRPYSWDRENIQEFWEDVVQDNPQDYFIGSMVVYKDGKQRYGVVDGQQRLTTITILLSVLRDKLADVGSNDLAAGIHGLIERKNIDNQPEFIVSTESSYPFFQDRIQKWGDSSIKHDLLNEESHLQAAHSQFKALVSTAIESVNTDTTLSPKRRQEQAEQKLVAIRDSLLNLKVILVKLEDEDDAYVIFETLNTRGKDLALTDLVKNHITKHIKGKNPSSDEVKVKWKQLLELIEGSSAELRTDAFIHHYWLSKYDYLPAKSLFKVLKKRITAAQASGFLDELLSDAALYRTMNEPGYGKWAKEEREIQRALEALVIFRVLQQTPCVLSLLREFRTTKKLRKKHVEDAIVAIEKFHFLFTAATSQRSSGGISGMYAALGRRLFEAKDTQAAVSVIDDLKQKLRDRIPSIEEFKALFPDIIFTDNVTKQKKLVKYVLVGLGRHGRTTGASSVIDYDHMTIEHLFSQSRIGEPSITDSTVGQVGNLLLVSEDLNGKLKNRSFKDKKSILIDSGFPLPTIIDQAKDWGPTEIKLRTDQIAEEAYKVVWKP